MTFQNVSVVTPPAAAVVTVPEYTDHARLNGITVNVQETALKRRITAATQRCESYCRRSLIKQKLRAQFVPDAAQACGCACEYFPAAGAGGLMLRLPRGNVLGIESVSVDSGVLDSTGYVWDEAAPGLIVLAAPALWASVVYFSGYGEDAAAVPDAIKEGILEYATTLYEDRGGSRYGARYAVQVSGLPRGVQDLWAPFQVPMN